MYRKVLVTLCLVFCVAIPSHAALITVERADANFTSNNINLADYWLDIALSGIKSETFESATDLYKGSEYNHTIFRMTILLPGNLSGLFNFYAGLDAGNGAEFFVNGRFLRDVADDLWWANDWNNKDVVELTGLNFKPSNSNSIEVYWAENGNSGGSSFEFIENDGERFALSAENIQASIRAPRFSALNVSNLPTAPEPVPAPSTLALFGLALLGLRVKRCR
jgi:hypothetical protein